MTVKILVSKATDKGVPPGQCFHWILVPAQLHTGTGLRGTARHLTTL